MTSELRRVHSRFLDDNPLLHLALGMISAGKTLDTLLETYAAPDASPNSNDDESAAIAVEFVLGLIAFRRKLLGTLDAASNETKRFRRTATNYEEPKASPPVERSLWR
jgi:hypothetical protein